MARNKEHLDDTAVQLITQWFDEGPDEGAAGGGKPKRSAPLPPLSGSVCCGTPREHWCEDEDAQPSKARITRLFGTLSQKRRAAVRTDVYCSRQSSSSGLKPGVSPK